MPEEAKTVTEKAETNENEAEGTEGVQRCVMPVCKTCNDMILVDRLGGEYCTKLKKVVASPRPKFVHKDCPRKEKA